MEERSGKDRREDRRTYGLMEELITGGNKQE